MGIAITQLRHQLHGLLGVSIAVILGVAFVTAAILFGAVTERAALNGIAAQYAGTDIIVTSQQMPLGSETVVTVSDVPGVGIAEGRSISYPRIDAGSRMAFPAVAPLPQASTIRDQLTIGDGRLPTGPGEVVLSADTARSLDITSGAQVTFSIAEGTASATVVGILDMPSTLGGTYAPDAYLWPETLDEWFQPETFQSILVTTTDGTDPAGLTGTIESVLDQSVTARTNADQARADVASLSGGSDILTYGLIAFAVVALFVAGLVIANTFAILVAQRTRALALLRCVGATTRQVHRMVFVEAIITGAVASIIGVLAGIVLVAGGVRLVAALSETDLVSAGIPLSVTSVLVPLALGIIVTLIAASGPARAATRVAPLAALRPTSLESTASRPSLARLGLSAVLIATGAVLLGGGILLARQSGANLAILVGMAGGLLSFLGVVVGALLFVPRTIRTLGQLASAVAGPPARIAAVNSDRNPARTTATATALLISVTLVTMMLVGAATTRATLEREIDEHNPLDVMIYTDALYEGDVATFQAIPETVPETLASITDVEATLAVHQAEFELADQDWISVYAFDPELADDVFRDERQVAGLVPGTVLVGERSARDRGLVTGDTLTIGEGTSQLHLTVAVTNWSEWQVLMTAEDLERVVPGTEPSQIWARLSDGADPGDTIGEIQDRLSGTPGLWITGGAQQKASDGEFLDTLLLVVSALLGVAVAIALIGVGNTLSLSVIERTRESAVMRALGLTRRQLRQMLAIEGVLLAVAGAALGLVLGTIYGLVGAQTLLGGSWSVAIAIPAVQMGIVVVIAIVAGLLASVIPARAAARTAPVAALAE